MKAVALTPRLFLGDELDLPHEYLYGDGSGLIIEGKTVRVDNEEWAVITLLNLGVPMDEARQRIDHAKHGLQLKRAVDGRQERSEGRIDGRNDGADQQAVRA